MTDECDRMMNRRRRDRRWVSRILGRRLEYTEIVHHAAHKVLILCKNQTQHSLVHSREDALKVCGCADWRKCNICGEYDDPDNLSMRKSNIVHLKCRRCRERLAKFHRYARFAPALGVTGAA